MIGQGPVKDKIERAIRNGRLSHFMIFIGQEGSGRKTLSSEVAKMLKAEYVILPDSKIETLRRTIYASATSVIPTVYVIPEFDRASAGAKNSILKFTEELGGNIYIIATAVSDALIMPTLLSRAFTWQMLPYTPEELTQCIPDTNRDDAHRILQICVTPGDILKLVQYGVDEFYSFARKVYENIVAVPVENIFKITDKLAVKATDTEKYDAKLLIRACTRFAQADGLYSSVILSYSYLREFNNASVNKQMLLDTWLLNMRSQMEAEYEHSDIKG